MCPFADIPIGRLSDSIDAIAIQYDLTPILQALLASFECMQHANITGIYAVWYPILLLEYWNRFEYFLKSVCVEDHHKFN